MEVSLPYTCWPEGAALPQTLCPLPLPFAPRAGMSVLVYEQHLMAHVSQEGGANPSKMRRVPGLFLLPPGPVGSRDLRKCVCSADTKPALERLGCGQARSKPSLALTIASTILHQ